MIVIGFILFAAAVALGVDVVVENTGHLQVQAFGQSITATPGGILLVGAACGLVGIFGLMLVRDALVRGRRRRVQARAATHQRDELAAQIEREREAHSEPVGAHSVSGRADSQLADLRDEPAKGPFAETNDPAAPRHRRIFSRN